MTSLMERRPLLLDNERMDPLTRVRPISSSPSPIGHGRGFGNNAAVVLGDEPRDAVQEIAKVVGQITVVALDEFSGVKLASCPGSSRS